MLRTELAVQMAMCGKAALLGIALMVFYDLLRAIRQAFGRGKWLTAVLDLLFCLTGLAMFLLFFLRETDGRLRGYLPLGLAGGMMLWRRTVSPLFLRLLLWLLHGAVSVLSGCGRAIVWMFRFPRGN